MHLCLTLVTVVFNAYLQVTFTYTVWFSGLPKPLYAVQVNVPASLLSMFVIFSTFPTCTTPVFPWFPGFSLVQVMFGSTRLNTSQINCKLSPSRTVGSPLIPLIFVGTMSNQTITINFMLNFKHNETSVKRLLSVITHASLPVYSNQHLFGFEFTLNPLIINCLISL